MARFLLPLRLEGGAIAHGETVAFLSSVIPAQAGIQRPKTRHSPRDSRLRGNDGLVYGANSVPHRRCPKMCAARDHCWISSKIAPLRVVALDQFQLPCPAPLFNVLFAQNGVRHRLVKFHMDQKMDAILLGKAVGGARLVRPGSAKNVARHPDVESTVPLAGKNVNARVFHDWSVNPRRAGPSYVIPRRCP
jgi:hypothetical protein